MEEEGAIQALEQIKNPPLKNKRKHKSEESSDEENTMYDLVRRKQSDDKKGDSLKGKENEKLKKNKKKPESEEEEKERTEEGEGEDDGHKEDNETISVGESENDKDLTPPPKSKKPIDTETKKKGAKHPDKSNNNDETAISVNASTTIVRTSSNNNSNNNNNNTATTMISDNEHSNSATHTPVQSGSKSAKSPSVSGQSTSSSSRNRTTPGFDFKITIEDPTTFRDFLNIISNVTSTFNFSICTSDARDNSFNGLTVASNSSGSLFSFGRFVCTVDFVKRNQLTFSLEAQSIIKNLSVVSPGAILEITKKSNHSNLIQFVSREHDGKIEDFNFELATIQSEEDENGTIVPPLAQQYPNTIIIKLELFKRLLEIVNSKDSKDAKGSVNFAIMKEKEQDPHNRRNDNSGLQSYEKLTCVQMNLKSDEIGSGNSTKSFCTLNRFNSDDQTWNAYHLDANSELITKQFLNNLEKKITLCYNSKDLHICTKSMKKTDLRISLPTEPFPLKIFYSMTKSDNQNPDDTFVDENRTTGISFFVVPRADED